jgi:hypothetical protein
MAETQLRKPDDAGQHINDPGVDFATNRHGGCLPQDVGSHLLAQALRN